MRFIASTSEREAAKKGTLSKLVRPEPNPPKIHSWVYSLSLELHPFSASMLAGTPGESVAVPDRFAWTGYDRYGGPCGVGELSFLTCPYGTIGDKLRLRKSEFGPEIWPPVVQITSVKLKWVTTEEGYDKDEWVWELGVKKVR